MTQREIQDYLRDILDAVDAIERFTADVDFEEFSQNLEKVFAVSSAMENVTLFWKRHCRSAAKQWFNR
ncbi:MAG: hypothetical protein WA939_05165 [Nodosilinea sp.]